MAASSRVEVLSIFRKLHRTRQMIFGGDKYALTEARKKINSEFKNRTALADPAEIEKAIGTAREAELVLRTTVVQTQLVDSDQQVFKVKVNPDTLRNENAKMKVGDIPANIRDDN